jgi:glycosyltransferase involved in cell wall biosynthesis
VNSAALFLTPEAPYPTAGGGSLRAASLLEYLARRYAVDLIVFREPGAPDPRDALPAGAVHRVHVIELPGHSKHPVQRVLRNGYRLLLGTPPLVHRFSGYGREIQRFLDGREYAVTVVGCMWCAPYWEQFARCSRQTVLDVMDVESVLFTRYAQVARWPAAAAYRRFRDLSLDLERLWFPRYSIVLATSPHDDHKIRTISAGSDVIVYPNAIPAVEAPPRPEEDVVVFSGNLEYPPNISAVRFFRNDIWPRLRARWPGLIWRLVGKNPQFVHKHVRGDPRIQLSGPVSDSIAAIAVAKVAVAPILVGSGTRVKIIEAWAAGRAVVTTTIGAEGLAARHGENVLLADDHALFADTVSAVLESPDLRRQIGRGGRATFEEAYTWDAAWRQLSASGRF